MNQIVKNLIIGQSAAKFPKIGKRFTDYPVKEYI